MTEGNIEHEFSVTDDIIKGSVVINKIDSADNTIPLEGAVFELRTDASDATTTVATLTTNAAGTAYATVRPGIYYLVETQAPGGYFVLSHAKLVLVKPYGRAEYDIEDDIIGSLEITKVDGRDGETGLEGAAFTLSNAVGTVATLTTDGNGAASIDNLRPGSYTLTETTVPDGYAAADPITFTVSVAKAHFEYTIPDAPTDVTISKTSLVDGEELEGAHLALYLGTDTTATPLYTWETSGANNPYQIVAELLASETYTLVETQAPDGYVIAERVTFTVNTDGTAQKVEMKDAPTDVTFSKRGLIGTAEIPGATLTIYDENNLEVEGWESTGTAHRIVAKLVAGQTYTLTKTSPPSGYAYSESVEFTVRTDGTAQTVVMRDAKTYVAVIKLTTDGLPLANASLEIRNGDNEVVESWVSNGLPHVMRGVLNAGETYTLVETAAPAGYAVADPVTFTVNTEAGLRSVVMRDKPTDASFSKTSVTGTAELFGAHLVLKNRFGITIDQWTSGTQPHRIVARLLAGEQYTLTEISAPYGYVLTESITFTVGTDGVPQTVTMVDAPTDVTISKTSLVDGEELDGAHLALYLGTDTTATPVYTWVTSGANNPNRFVAELIAGETYTLVETSAPNGYVVAESVEFTVGTDGVPQTITMEDKPTDVTFSKTGITEGEELEGATLTIYDADNREVETWVSTDTAHQIVAKLLAGATYTLVEETAPDGYVVAESVEFTVGTDGVPQTVTMEDKPTDVTISKTSLVDGEELDGAHLALYLGTDTTATPVWLFAILCG